MAPKCELKSQAGKVDLLFVPVYTGRELGAGSDAVGDNVAAFMAGAGFDGKRDEMLAVPTAKGVVVLVGVGDPDTYDLAAVRRTGALIARRAAKVATVATTVLDAVGGDHDR